jgi:hypothetical protein
MRSQVVLVTLLGLVAACGGKATVSIDCISTAVPSIDCTLSNLKGAAEADVCWNAAVTCGNGQVVSAPNTCFKIKDGQTERVVIPAESLTGMDKCQGTTPPTMKIGGLTINGNAAEWTDRKK